MLFNGIAAQGAGQPCNRALAVKKYVVNWDWIAANGRYKSALEAHLYSCRESVSGIFSLTGGRSLGAPGLANPQGPGQSEVPAIARTMRKGLLCWRDK